MVFIDLSFRKLRMEWNRIRKRPEDRAGANLAMMKNFAQRFPGRRRAGFSMKRQAAASTSRILRSTAISPTAGAKSSHCAGSGATTASATFTYAALGAAVNRFANVLAQRRVGKGDRVFSLLGRVPELYLAALGTLKNGSVFSPLFSDFGPQPIKARMTIGDAKVLITSEAFYRRKIEPWRRELASLEVSC